MIIFLLVVILHVIVIIFQLLDLFNK
jgi:hypothetical protein